VFEGSFAVGLVVALCVIGWLTDLNRRKIDDFAGRVAPLVKNSNLNSRKIDEIAGRVAPLVELSDSNRKKIDDIAGQVAEQVNMSSNNSKMLRDLAAQESDGHGVLRLWGNQPSESARQVFKKAVADSVSSDKGELAVYNDTNVAQHVHINSDLRDFAVRPKKGLIFTVPSGTATTEIAGDSVRNWYIGPADYRQNLAIVQREQGTESSPGKYMVVPLASDPEWQRADLTQPATIGAQ
jgi:hypothetical protein